MQEILRNDQKVEKAGKLGPDEQREKKEGDPRRYAGIQESVLPELQQQVQEEEEQDEEEQEERALILARFMEQKKYTNNVLIIVIQTLGHWICLDFA